jgi:hypothetical protein
MKNILLLLGLLSLSHVSFAKTSLEERQEDKFQVTLGTFIEYSETTGTVSAGYNLSPDDILLLRYTSGHGTSSESNKGIFSVSVEALTIGYRKFFGNSFNIMPTLYFRSHIENRVNTPATPDIKMKDIGAGFRIGNEWQTDYFIIGCDWFGLNHSIYKKTRSQYNILTEPRLSLTLLSFYVGVNF